jgi:hypothetical protein
VPRLDPRTSAIADTTVPMTASAMKMPTMSSKVGVFIHRMMRLP